MRLLQTATFVTLLCIATVAFAAGKTMTFSFPGEGWPPYVIQTEDRASGIMPDVLAAIAEKYQYTLNFIYVPDKRGTLMLENGTVDVRPKAREWMEFPDRFLWTEPIVNSTDVLVFRKGHEFPFRTGDDLIGKTIGCIHGFGYPTLNALFENRQAFRHDVMDTEKLLGMLKLGRIDAAVTNELVARWIIRNDRELALNDFSFALRPVDTVPYRLMFSDNGKWKNFIPRFNSELNQMKVDGRFEAILKKYQ